MNSEVKVAIIGAGQIGSRHLQALKLVRTDLEIYVFDPSSDSLKIAKERYDQIESKNQHTILFIQNLKELPKAIDIAIVATNSIFRRKAIEELLAHSSVQNLILEKFLFPKIRDFEIVEGLLSKNKIKAFVNCPRRLNSFYRNLQNVFKGEEPIHFAVSGANWGLACNSIHYIDLFSFITGTVNFHFSNKSLDATIVQSKRANYIEFTGSLEGYDNNKNKISLTCYKEGDAPMVIDIRSKNHRYLINEGVISKVYYSGAQNNWSWIEDKFEVGFQSQLTNIVMEDLINKGDCNLTPYAESSIFHQACLTSFINFLEIVENKKVEECPIT